MAFRALFHEARSSHGFVGDSLRQEDTAMFDNFAADASSKGVVAEVADPEILLLRSVTITHAAHRASTVHMVERVVQPPVVPKVKSDYTNSNMEPYAIPEIDWQHEVESVMNVTESEEEFEEEDALSPAVGVAAAWNQAKGLATSVKILRHLHCASRLDLESVVPAECFDIDAVTRLDANADALDVLIPNRCVLDDVVLETEGEVAMNVVVVRAPGSQARQVFPVFAPPDATSFLTAPARVTADVAADEEVARVFSPQLLSKPERTAAAKSNMSNEERQAELQRKKKERLDAVNLMALNNVNFNINANVSRFDDDGFFARGNRSDLSPSLPHSRVATSCLNTPPDLTAIRLKYFHRPRMPRTMRKQPWRISVRNISRGKQQAGRRRNLEFDRSDLSVASGEFVLFEYIEEHPPYMLNYGMASAVYNYYRSSSGAEDAEEEQGHKRRERDAADATLKAHGRLPRHVTLLLQHQNRKQTYEHDANIPRLQLGETKVLGPTDPSPFLGDIREGQTQPALANNLFRAPLFKHEVPSTDFLLICTHQGGGAQHYGHGGAHKSDVRFMVRPIPHTFLCGQMEPQVTEADKCVPRPLKASGSGVSRVLKTQNLMLALAIARYFTPENFRSQGVELEAVRQAILSDFSKDRMLSPHRDQLRQRFGDLVKIIAEQTAIRDPNHHHGMINQFRPRDPYSEGYSDQYSPDEVVKLISPEDVCVDESSLAAEFRMREYGIYDALPLQDVERWLFRITALRAFKEDRAVQVKWMLDQEVRKHGHLSEPSKRLSTLFNCVFNELKALDKRIAVGQFIFRKLLTAPWNTTYTFYHAHANPDGLGRMTITHELGDPSARGEGFAFVRLLQEKSNKAVKKVVAPVGSLHNTNRDLRKINDEDAIKLLVSFGLEAGKMRELKRWDRIALIRGFATYAVTEGSGKQKPETNDLLMRYARGGAVDDNPVPVVENKQNFKEVCNEIWSRQSKALSCPVPPATDDDDDDDDDKLDALMTRDDSNSKAVAELISQKAILYGRRKSEEAVHAAQPAGVSRDEDKAEFLAMRSMFNPTAAAAAASSSASASASAGSAPKVRFEGSQRGDATGTGAGTGQGAKIGGGEGLGSHAGGAADGYYPQPGLRQYPQRIVRRKVRTVYEDGTEEVTIQFLLTEKDLLRVEKDLKRMAFNIASGGGEGADPRGRGNRERMARLIEGAEDHSNMNFAGEGGKAMGGGGQTGLVVKAPSLAIPLGKMKDNVARAQQESVRQLAKESGDMHAKPTSVSRGAGFKRERLPHVALAAIFEAALVKLYSNKATPEFWLLWNPVPRNYVSPTGVRYHDIISEPMSLSEIRDHNGMSSLSSAGGTAG